jgi:flagellar biosynthetic protein FliQ
MMTSQNVLTIAQQALEMTVLVSAPLLFTALAVGLLVSIFQAATQINEMTLSFIPKLLAMFAALIIAGPWMLTMLTDYIQRLFSSIPQLVG